MKFPEGLRTWSAGQVWAGAGQENARAAAHRRRLRRGWR
jgi:hypothetical protein